MIDCLIVFLENDQLPTLMQGAVVAVFTLLVPFAIAVLLEYLQNKRQGDKDLDLYIVLDHVWKFKWFLVAFAAILLILFLYPSVPLWLKPLLFSFYLLILCYFFQTIYKFYQWVKGDRHSFRLCYLTNLPLQNKDAQEAWLSLWSTDQNKNNHKDERQFFKVWSDKIDGLLNSKEPGDWETLSTLLNNFEQKVENRNQYFITFNSAFFPKILKWHYKLYCVDVNILSEDESKKYGEENLRKKYNAVECSRSTIRKLIYFVTKQALAHDGNEISYFQNVKNHIDKVNNVDKKKYMEYLLFHHDIRILDILLEACKDVLFVNDCSRNLHDWQVTYANLEKADNVAARLWCTHFVQWFKSKNDGINEWDNRIYSICQLLFPQVNPKTWIDIILFIVSWHSADQKMKETVERELPPSGIESAYIGDGHNIEKELLEHNRQQEEATISLAFFIYPGVFTIENFSQWLEELDKLEYPEGSTEADRKKLWKNLLTKIKEERESKEA